MLEFNPPSRKASGAYAKASATACGREGQVNSTVLAPFLESRACSGVHTI
jgi:hypothetical protein